MIVVAAVIVLEFERETTARVAENPGSCQEEGRNGKSQSYLLSQPQRQ